MSRYFIVLCLFILSSVCNANASFDSTRHALGIVKLYPFQLGERYIAYEHVFNEKHSMEAGAGVIRYVMANPSGMLSLPQPYKSSGFAARLQHKTNITKQNRAPFGFAHGPKLTYRHINLNYNEYTPDTILSPTGVLIGSGRYDMLAAHYMLALQGRIFSFLSFQFDTGLGLRIKKVGRINGEPGHFHSLMVGSKVGKSAYPNLYWSPSFQFNFGLGFVIYKKK